MTIRRLKPDRQEIVFGRDKDGTQAYLCDGPGEAYKVFQRLRARKLAYVRRGRVGNLLGD